MPEDKPTRKSFLTEYYKPITISVITAIIVSVINYFVWQRQNSTTQRQKLYDYKLSLFEKFANSSAESISNFEFTCRIKVEQYKLEFKIGDSINKMNPSNPIDTLPYDYRLSIQKKLQSLYPLEYSMHMKFLEQQHQAHTNINLAKLLFEEPIQTSLSSFEDLFTERSIKRSIDSLLIRRHTNFPEIDDDELASQINREQTELFSLILTDMFKELKPK